jgi:hypothetical protein
LPWRRFRFPTAVRQPATGEFAFDAAPPSRKIGISRRQRPDRMQMVGKKDDGVELKWLPFEALAKRFPKQLTG